MEISKITLGDQQITYAIKENARARHLRLTIQHNGTLVVSVPRYVPKRVVLGFIKQQSEWILKKHQLVLARAPKKTFTHRDYLKNKYPAKVLVRDRLEFFNKLYGFSYKNISIRNQSSRWGSCSRSGNLNFNFKILFLEKAEQDYIVVHELCHLKELNHSPRFWKLVSLTIPDYKARIRKLRDSGLEMQ